MAHLDVAPPVRAIATGALGEVNLLAGELVVERVLVADIPRVAVEGNARKGVRGLLHLQMGQR